MCQKFDFGHKQVQDLCYATHRLEVQERQLHGTDQSQNASHSLDSNTTLQLQSRRHPSEKFL